MRLTKSTSHAIRILIGCARSDGALIKVAMLSAHLGITQQNVFKIVNLLTRAGLIEGVRGRNGGVRLARPAHTIRISDVVRATEVTHVEIEDAAPARRRGQAAAVNQVLDEALEAFLEVLEQHTLADMVGNRTATDMAAPRRAKGGAKAAATAAQRFRRTSVDNG